MFEIPKDGHELLEAQPMTAEDIVGVVNGLLEPTDIPRKADSIYDYMCLRHGGEWGTFSSDDISRVIQLAKSNGVLTDRAGSIYGDVLRMITEQAEPDVKIVDLIRDYCRQLPSIYPDIVAATNDIQIIYGIPADLTIDGAKQKVQETEQWNAQKPHDPKYFPNFFGGCDNFYDQNIGAWC